MPEVIVARGLKKQITSGGQSLAILRGVDLAIARGEAVAVLGRSGSGKTTLLSLLAGLDVPSEGDVLLDGVSLVGLSEDARARLRAGRVGFVFQSFQLLPALSAQENVELAADLAGLADAIPRAREALERVGLAARADHRPHQLSGGEQQRVAIARAFVTAPQLLFADEPTGNLDAETGRSIVDLLFALQAQHQTTLVLVTHDEQLAQRCARRLTLEDGRLRD